MNNEVESWRSWCSDTFYRLPQFTLQLNSSRCYNGLNHTAKEQSRETAHSLKSQAAHLNMDIQLNHFDHVHFSFRCQLLGGKSTWYVEKHHTSSIKEKAPLPSICTIFSRENQSRLHLVLSTSSKGNTNLKRLILQTIGIEVLPLAYCMYNSTLKETY